MTGSRDLEALAVQLEDSGDYRVLRRLKPWASGDEQGEGPVRRGIYLDTETTGTDPAHDEIIEIAMLPFTYRLDGQIVSVGEPFEALREPSQPIPAEITRLTGIDDAMVAGRIIDPAEVAAFAAPAAIIIAHNASFDRRFIERFAPGFEAKPWACSMSQVDWAAAGFEGTKLAYLAAGCGFFYDRHRAVSDCAAALEILSRPLSSSNRPALSELLETARRPTWRIWAEGAPFDLKDVLKRRGYRWNAEAGGAPRAWWIDVDEAGREAEIAFLQAEIYRGEVEPLMRKITAYERFSDRC